MPHFFVSRALREIKKTMRERGSKCATFAQNHIWTHWSRKTALLPPPQLILLPAQDQVHFPLSSQHCCSMSMRKRSENSFAQGSVSKTIKRPVDFNYHHNKVCYQLPQNLIFLLTHCAYFWVVGLNAREKCWKLYKLSKFHDTSV